MITRKCPIFEFSKPPNMKRIAFIFIVLTGLSVACLSQESGQYIPETDPAVLAKLEQWKDMKFGLLMHWGT